MTPEGVHGDLFVWMQRAFRRDPAETIRSFHQSDIATNFVTITDTNAWNFPEDYPKLQAWWEDQMLAMAERALSHGCTWMLRLEDDIVVNTSIVHNVATWQALRDPRFGMGTLFRPNYWNDVPRLLTVSPASGASFREAINVEGGQGQVLRVSSLETVIPLTRQARRDLDADGLTDCVNFDSALSRAIYLADNSLKTFVHDPALVDIHPGSCHSLLLGEHDPETHYWGDKQFDPTWKHSYEPPLNRHPQRRKRT